MHLWDLPFFSLLRGRQRVPLQTARSRRRAGRLHLEALEDRLNLSTYYWTALGDGATWNDPMNWGHNAPTISMLQPGVPPAYSDVVFPPIASLPKGSTSTINFNFSYLYQPLNSLTVDDSYTFEGTAITIENALNVKTPFTPNSATTVMMQLSGMQLASGAAVNVSSGATLDLGTTSAPTGFQLTLQGPTTKTGGGALVVNTQSVFYPTTALNNNPVPVTIGAGSITFGENVSLSAINVQINPSASLNIADDVSAQVRSITGTGLIDLEGTTATGDTTSLSVGVPNSSTDQFGGLIEGTGQFIASGNGDLTIGTITMNGTGSIGANYGTFTVDGSISAGSLTVGQYGTFGGLGTWSFSGPVVFQPGATFQVTLNGTTPSSQYTQLVDTNSTSGINLGTSTLAAVIGYEYEQGDQFTILSAPLITGSFQNVNGGRTVLGASVPFGVTATGTSVTIAPLQSITSTAISTSASPTNPGVPVTFTATVTTRTTTVGTGTVTFMQGTTALGTVAVGPGGTASLTTTSLPLGTTTITAVYNGGGTNLGSTSSGITQSVVPFTSTTSLTSNLNPSVFGQAVTFTAGVVAGGAPVTSGSITFRRGSQFLGVVALGASGTASLTISSLPAGKASIQAIFSGTTDDLSSVSAVLTQTVTAVPTATTLTLATQTLANGKTRYVLVATVGPAIESSVAATGKVVFRKNGRMIGSAKLKGGVATLVIGRSAPRGKYVAAFARNSQFKASTSAPLVLPS
jgi:hypothetical protein